MFKNYYIAPGQYSGQIFPPSFLEKVGKKTKNLGKKSLKTCKRPVKYLDFHSLV